LTRQSPAAKSPGTSHKGIAEGAITEDDVRTELGGVIVGAQDGRSSDDDITLFESVGVGLQDLATAELVVARAEELGVGMRLDLGV
jgi:ornithine cyclodeaminase/alanine dehydrogenase